ncbi:glutathione S-transferase family protein [Seongchinamella unica]|nr:glutathione S-transferase C-terminal domain-containing protein [Seongchinamella unica]
MDYVSVADARDGQGLRVVLTKGVPGPWGESIKAMLAYKGLDYLPVAQDGGGENPELRAWTGQTAAPVLVSDELPPACHWLDQLMLLERLQPEPALLPADCDQRSRAIGLCALIAGADGFGWQRRLLMLQPMMDMESVPARSQRLAQKYGYSAEAVQQAVARMRQISQYLEHSLSNTAGDYFFGGAPGAVDFYWANFAGMIKPLPPELNPMPDWFRPIYTSSDPQILECLSAPLEKHRDMMYERHIATPLEF